MPRVRQYRTTRRNQPLQSSAGTVCKHPHHFCQKECLDGYTLCAAHILEDRTAPYRPCAFIYGNGQKCGAAVSKKDSQQQCSEHRVRLMLARERTERPKEPPESLESLTEQLRENQAAEPGGSGEGWEVAQRALLYRSESDSEPEADRLVESPLEPALSSEDDISGLSDDDDDPLRHAAVYTDEEVIKIAEQRLRRLQKLYVGQFERLKHVLETKRRTYLIEVAREKETMKSISGAPRESQSEQQAYELLKAHGHYQKPAGKDYLYWQQRHDKRTAEAGGAVKAATVTKCSHTEGRVRCSQRTIPLSKFCLKHIIEDQHQVLFRPCGGGGPAEPCQTPVAGLREESRCLLHTPLPPATDVRMPQEPADPVEAMFGLAEDDDLALDETQSRLVASIASTLMASAGIGGATELTLGGAGGADAAAPPGGGEEMVDVEGGVVDVEGGVVDVEGGERSEFSSEVDVTGDTRSASPADGVQGDTEQSGTGPEAAAAKAEAAEVAAAGNNG